jgi:hypothetical protein
MIYSATKTKYKPNYSSNKLLIILLYLLLISWVTYSVDVS